MSLAALLPHIETASDLLAQANVAAAHMEELELARQQQEEAIRAQLATEYEARFAELASAHQQALQIARQEWCEGEAAALAASLAQQVDAASAALASCMHRVLAPFATDAVSKAAVLDLCSKVHQAAASDLKAEIRLEGPDDLVKAMHGALVEAGFETIAVGPIRTELQLRVGETRLLSHLPEWLAALKDTAHG